MKYSLHHIAQILGSKADLPAFNLADEPAFNLADEPAFSLADQPDNPVENILLDSRRLMSAGTSLYFALKGDRRDGRQFIPELYKKGVRSFIVSEPVDPSAYPGAGFILVNDTLQALQLLAIYHRQQFDLPVIGITGSNGKTIVKEWLCQLLHQEHTIVRSPKSYNSQIGVPLSVWQIAKQHTLGIFEAGISKPGEMDRLEAIIKPVIGILTNIGQAHDEGFENKLQKLQEKLKLFANAQVVIARETDIAGHEDLINATPGTQELLTWGYSANNDLIIKQIDKLADHTSITLCSAQKDSAGCAATYQIEIPFTDDASVENAVTCFLTLLHLGVDPQRIIERMKVLHPVNMRLELKKGINHCSIINDSYSADISSLNIALNFLDQHDGTSRKTVILSDLLQSGEQDEQLYGQILSDLRKHNVTRLIGIGERISGTLRNLAIQHEQGLKIELYSSTDAYIQQFLTSQFREEAILIKGARVFGFERIVQLLEQKVHQTVLEINLNAIAHNVKVYQQQLRPTTKIMAMVKAFAYGSGGAEVAGILQFHQVDYLGVAYADEGVELRRAGVTLPIMVMNPEEMAFEAILEHNLEPDIYSMSMLRAFDAFLEREGALQYPVHIEIETGMNRLGFPLEEVEALASHLRNSNTLRVQSVFSHLASSEDPNGDEFTMQQYHRLGTAVAVLKGNLNYNFLTHISNSAAIFRLPQLQMDMVRLGIGMYGVDSATNHQALLTPAATLKTTIAQLSSLRPGESVSYNRRGVVSRESVIATVRIGYADGYSRRLGNGVGSMLIHGKLAPVIGTICMDMTMVDVTDIPDVVEGDEVIIFGKGLPIQELASWAGTIPYEIMTSISQRVKRVYFEE